MVTFCRLYADDSSLQHSSNNLRSIETCLNSDLTKLQAWSEKWLLKFNPSKTKALFFTRNRDPEYPKLNFQQCQLQFVDQHKHLGIIFSPDLSWSHYIDTILANANKKLGIMKKYKFKINRNTLSLMYKSFIRPQLEYASEVWGTCLNQNESEKLEKLQLNAARIVTGLTLLASRESLYLETGWEPLNQRRKLTRLKTMYKVDKQLTPNYLRDIFPSKFSSYNTRNTLNYSVPKCKLQLYKHSFVPTVINEWNSLPENIKTSESIVTFMNKVKTKQNSPPVYFACGIRRLNILHTRLRHNCILNKDLFRCNIINSPLCTCGKIEDEYHYFFTCPRYKDARNVLFNNIFKINNLHIVNTHVLLWGDNSILVFLIINIYFQLYKYI